jgi:hypothetical protein
MHNRTLSEHQQPNQYHKKEEKEVTKNNEAEEEPEEIKFDFENTVLEDSKKQEKAKTNRSVHVSHQPYENTKPNLSPQNKEVKSELKPRPIQGNFFLTPRGKEKNAAVNSEKSDKFQQVKDSPIVRPIISDSKVHFQPDRTGAHLQHVGAHFQPNRLETHFQPNKMDTHFNVIKKRLNDMQNQRAPEENITNPAVPVLSVKQNQESFKKMAINAERKENSENQPTHAPNMPIQYFRRPSSKGNAETPRK